MKHHYSTINGIVTTFSDIHQSAQKGESILVYMERAAENGFDTAEILLPSISFVSYTHKRPLRGHCAPPLVKGAVHKPDSTYAQPLQVCFQRRRP